VTLGTDNNWDRSEGEGVCPFCLMRYIAVSKPITYSTSNEEKQNPPSYVFVSRFSFS